MGLRLKEAFMFITKMGILLTTILLTWSVYQSKNIFRCLKISTGRRCFQALKGSGRLRANGMGRQKVLNGIAEMLNRLGISAIKFLALARFAARVSAHGFQTRNFALAHVGIKKDFFREWMTRSDFVKSVGLSSESTDIEKRGLAQQFARGNLDTKTEKVYNIQVEDVNCYFANGVLVGNCDSLAYHQAIAKRPYGGSTEHMPSSWRELINFRKKKRGDSLAAKL